MYARRKDWDLKEVKVHVSHQKTTHHLDDMSDIHNQESRIDQFSLAIEMSGDLGINQKLRLLEIADKCPIHRTLDSPQVFKTELINS
jgi:putative redox protein